MNTKYKAVLSQHKHKAVKEQKTMKNIPNQLTMSRILLVVGFVILANFDAENANCFTVTHETAKICHWIAYILAIVGGLTDLFDGYLARKYHWESDFGRLIDPLADKLFIMATFAMFVDYQYMPAWILIVILGREFMVTGLRTLATAKGIVISADKWGKLKTASQMITLAFGGAAWVELIPPVNVPGTAMHTVWMVALYTVAALTLLSGASYFIKHKKLYLESMF